MKYIVKAEFDSADMAEYAVRHISDNFAGAKGNVMSKNSPHDKYYSYAGRIPENVPLAVPYQQTINNVFVPSFPENSTLGEIRENKGAYIEITCDSTVAPIVKSQIMALGGSLKR